MLVSCFTCFFFLCLRLCFIFLCSAICYRFELLCCSTKTLGLSDLDVQYLNLEKYFHQFVRCHGVMFDWLILLTVTVFCLVVCFFPLAILILYFSQDMYKYSFLFFWVIFYRLWVFANLFVISFKSIKW